MEAASRRAGVRLRRRPPAVPQGSGAAVQAELRSSVLTRGVFTLWLSIMVLLPLIALLVRSTDEGMASFWDSATNEQTIEALRYTILVALGVTGINVVFGTLIAWVLVRDDFRGKG